VVTRQQVALRIGRLIEWNKQKVFCVGMNKTGTTSLTQALRELGMRVAPQHPAELLLDDWKRRDFRRLVQLCKSYQAFQDVPFSLPYTFQALDEAFPGSRFVLTVRDSPEQWWRSLTEFHGRITRGATPPTFSDLANAEYCRRGWLLAWVRAVFPVESDDLYNQRVLTEHYERHNQSVAEYFRHRPHDLLIVNVASEGAHAKLCEFLGVEATRQHMPWANKTQEVGRAP
jgi:hypothetical protein